MNTVELGGEGSQMLLPEGLQGELFYHLRLKAGKSIFCRGKSMS
jgi:hypothetical protein